MKADNIILIAVGSLITLMAWAALGPDTKAAGSVSSPDLRAAIATGQPVLVDFYADWCGPCKMMTPVVHELANELCGKLQTVQINVDQQQALAQQYGVRSIPCFVVLKSRKETARQVGSMPKATLRQLTGL
ncbi:MAG: thiol reductase thioredoxin [Verrucomicrobiaceae bacterium]|nr:thiol reductase thioredoxin [Verrucomicrobiaceae bacterium]